MVRVAGAMKKSTEVMSSMNSMIKLPEMQRSMMEMSRGVCMCVWGGGGGRQGGCTA